MTDNNEQRLRNLTRQAAATTAHGTFQVVSPNVKYQHDVIESKFNYSTIKAKTDQQGNVQASPIQSIYHFQTIKKPRRLGLMQVGWGGNNGTTVTAAILANQHSISWQTKDETLSPNYNGSLTQASTVRIGFDQNGTDIFVPMKSIIPMVDPNQIILGGWDISAMNISDAMDRAKVLEPDLKTKLRPYTSKLKPLAGVFDQRFIAKNQKSRADNVIDTADKQKQLDQIRKDIQQFKQQNQLEFIVVMWTANSERYAVEEQGVNDTAANLLNAIKTSHKEVSPSTIYCVASILEGCPYINGSPQNTFVPGVLELAEQHNVVICGDDFKSGQTKMKSVLADYLIGCGLKIKTMVTYNHLGNNDMYQLTDEVMWKPKSASKSRVIEDIVDSNGLLYKNTEDRPDHVVVVKYVPFLGDSKRDVSEYTTEGFMNCHYTTIMHNTCLDSALCAPLIIDLAILAELFSRVSYKVEFPDEKLTMKEYSSMESAMSALAFYMKIPRVPKGEQIINALGRQKACIENILRALVGLQPESNMLLETKFPFT